MQVPNPTRDQEPTMTDPDRPTPLETLDEVLDLAGGLSILLLPLFPLAVPGVVVLGVVLVPLAAVGVVVALAGAILASPYLLLRSVRRRASP
jgi:hypothetical protein